jgi:hypothetical protein
VKEGIQNKAVLLARNAQSVKQEFKWQHAMTIRLAALQYTLEGKAVDCDEIRRCLDLIKGTTGIFSSFRGNMVLCIAAMLSLSDDPGRLFENTVSVYGELKKAKFRASDFLAVAAFQIASGADASDYSRVVERAKDFYKGMKALSWFNTGQDDYIFAAMLGLSDIDVKIGTQRIEQIYGRLKPRFRNKNSVSTLSHLLVLGESCDGVVDRVLALRDVLKAQKLRFDRAYTLSSLGVLALLPAEKDLLVGDLSETRDFLRTQKGFGKLTVSTEELLIYTAAIVSSEYAKDISCGVLTAALSTSITNIIIAQQVAMIAAISAASAVAAAR